MPYADREVGNAYRRAYRKKHLEKFRQIEANSKKKNQWKYRERGRKYAAAWRKANPEKYKATVRRRAIKTRKPPKKPRIKIYSVRPCRRRSPSINICHGSRKRQGATRGIV